MVNADTLDINDCWSLNFIFEGAQQKLEEGRINEAKKLCIHGQIESLKKNHKDWGKKFDELYIKIDIAYETFNKDEIGQVDDEKLEDTDIINLEGNTDLISISGVGASMAKKLNENQIFTIEQLSEYSPDKLSKFKGIGANSAKKIIDNAMSLLDKKEEKEKFLNIEDFVEKPPEVFNTIPIVDTEDNELIPVEVDIPPDFDRLNDYNGEKNGNAEQNDNQDFDKANSEILREIDNDFQENHNNSEISNLDDILRDFNDVNLESEKDLSHESDLVNEITYKKYFGEDNVDFSVEKENKPLDLKIEQINKFAIETAAKKIEKKLTIIGCKVIPKDSRIQLGKIFKNIDVLGFKIVKINDVLEQILIYPIKICNLKGVLIISDENFDYKPSQEEITINEKEKELLINSNLNVLQAAHQDIFHNIINEGGLFRLLRKYIKKDIIVEKTRSNKSLFFRNGQLQYKILIEPILISQNDIGFLEKTLIFPYIKNLNLHIVKKQLIVKLLDFIENKHVLINTYAEQSNSIKSYFKSRDRFINNLRLSSVPFIIYGFIFLMIIIFQAYFIINIFAILTIGVMILYGLIVIYLYIRFNNEKKLISEEFKTPEYLRPIRLDETDLLIIKNELSTELLDQFIFECFGKRNDFKITSEIEQIKLQNQLYNRENQNNYPVQGVFEKKNDDKQILSKYMSLLED